MEAHRMENNEVLHWKCSKTEMLSNITKMKVSDTVMEKIQVLFCHNRK